MPPTPPLRKVIGDRPHPQFPNYPELSQEVYECGHVARPKQDIYGTTVSARRRCRACMEGRPPDVDIAAFTSGV